LTFLKKIFQDTCPECDQLLALEDNELCCVKVCPHGHYKEEIYRQLGVRIVFEN
jgi:hypothetical protein